MSLFVGIFCTLFSFSLWATTTTVVGQVSDVDTGSAIHDEILVFLSGGQVAKISPGEKQLLDDLHEAEKKEHWYTFTLDENRHIVSMTITEAPKKDPGLHYLKSLENYTPSVMSSPEEALSIFQSARIKHKDSQCYNRAHIWTYEWRVKDRLFTSKAWLFFTRKYIRKFNFEWWFHVAPYFHVQDGDRVVERIADVKYARQPLKFKTWTDIFLRNDSDCPVVTNYSEWANYPETGWCYVMKSSMYYYQPLDMEILEKDGVERHVWDPNEVKQAYKEAFDIDV